MELIVIERSEGKVDIYQKLGELEIPYLWNADKDCEHDVKSQPSGGIKCTKCQGWVCY